MASSARVVVVDGPEPLLDQARRRLEALERVWSRFLADSDISRLNRTPNEWLEVATDTITLVETMQLAASLTEGRFDPTYLRELVATGYGRSIDDPERVTIVIDLPCPDHRVADAHIDRHHRSIMLPNGLALDPGGIGKGLAGDLVVAELLSEGARGVLVSVGGDISTGGDAPTDEGWVVDIAHPLGGSDALATVAVSNGGIATSSTRTRRWTHDGVLRHHVIDPATATTSRTDLAAVTVVASSGWRAEAHATAALLCGSAGAVEYLDAHGVSGVATTSAGDTTATIDLLAIGAVPVRQKVGS